MSGDGQIGQWRLRIKRERQDTMIARCGRRRIFILARPPATRRSHGRPQIHLPRLRGDDPLVLEWSAGPTDIPVLPVSQPPQAPGPISKYLSPLFWTTRRLPLITPPGRSIDDDGGGGQAGAGRRSLTRGTERGMPPATAARSLVPKSCLCEAFRLTRGTAPNLQRWSVRWFMRLHTLEISRPRNLADSAQTLRALHPPRTSGRKPMDALRSLLLL